MKKHIGSCSCGDIEFYFENDPINSIFCYCKECQALTGSDKWFGVWVPRDDKFRTHTVIPHRHPEGGSGIVNWAFHDKFRTHTDKLM
ncbi:GFA family protein [Vibrio ostreicida]|uniref:GFA family protein n=1 Tax=Vibrio ostreicida TaxID=526588 RepID=UPI003F5D6EC2